MIGLVNKTENAVKICAKTPNDIPIIIVFLFFVFGNSNVLIIIPKITKNPLNITFSKKLSHQTLEMKIKILLVNIW